jgi:hypothetical protein
VRIQQKRERMVTTKVIVFPVRGRRWAFAAQAATPVASSSSSSSVSQLWKRLLSVPKFTDRAQLLEQYVSTKMHDKWAELGAQPSESIRYRIYRYLKPPSFYKPLTFQDETMQELLKCLMMNQAFCLKLQSSEGVRTSAFLWYFQCRLNFFFQAMLIDTSCSKLP